MAVTYPAILRRAESWRSLGALSWTVLSGLAALSCTALPAKVNASPGAKECDAPCSSPESAAAPSVEAVEPEEAGLQRSYGLVRGAKDEADQWLLRGERALARKRYAEASSAFAHAAKLLPQHPAPQVGEVLAALGKSGLAVEFNSAPGNPEVLALLARLDAAPGSAPFWPRALLRGRLLLLLGQADAAEVALYSALQLAPEEAEVHSALGIAKLALGNKAAAKEHLERAAELEPDSAERLCNLGAAWMMLGQPENARETYERAIALNPDDARAHSDLGTTLLTLGQPRSALVELEHAQRLAPRRATIMNNLGYALQALGDYSLAERWYRAALAADATLASAWLNLGVLYAKQRRYDEAESALRQALALDPEDPRAIANLEELAAARSNLTAPNGTAPSGTASGSTASGSTAPNGAAKDVPAPKAAP
jgi:Tfp pilus assembly protein PilF